MRNEDNLFPKSYRYPPQYCFGLSLKFFRIDAVIGLTQDDPVST
jgi:hypothetical protein